MRDQPCIMLVDGNHALVSFLAVFFNHSGYKVIAASDTIQGLAIWQERKQDIDVVIAGLHFDAGPDGITFLGQLRQADPAAKVILSSGDYPSSEGYQWLRAHDIPFLPKPYLPQEILGIIANCLGTACTLAQEAAATPPPVSAGPPTLKRS